MKHSDARYPDEIAEDIARSQTLPATEELMARRSAAACSPSDTPETDAMASMRRTITEWKEHSEKLERERLVLAMLAADTPQFFNPMSAIHAKNLRDRLLSENS
jgi:hypothetical protein